MTLMYLKNVMYLMTVMTFNMNQQSKQELENWWSKPDAWGYKTNPDDQMRKDKIMSYLNKRYERALDIGAGEGWITKDLPAEKLEAIELSEKARARGPENVLYVSEPKGQYDLIIATGVFYDQYDWQQFHDWILNHASHHVLTSNIQSWEHPLPLRPVKEEVFDYREYKQHLCLYQIES